MRNPPLHWRFDGKEIVRAIDEWMKSEDGKRCTDGVASGVYLRNRLEKAFKAGMDAALRLTEQKEQVKQ